MAETLAGRLLNNRYQIVERVGIGGMAEVYRAQDNVLGRTVAVKVMLPQYAEDASFTARFRQEAAAAANLSSPYIVNVYDWGQDSGTYYIVMEFVRGSDLKTAISQRGAINQRKVAEIGSQVCQALSVAHNMDIVHRDIKPQNIMVQPDGNVKVMDFGIARAKNSNADKTSAVLGTAHYISPEQAQGKDLTGASDIYSLGIVMYESVTGELPFDGPDAVSVALKQVKDQPIPPSEINPNIDPTLEAIILKAMEKDPANRFATAQDMRRALNDYMQGRPVSFDGFGNATTAVMNPGVVPPISPAYGETTKVMPAVEQNGRNGSSDSQRDYKNANSNGSKSSSPSKKKGPIIAIAAIAVIALFAVLAFAVFGGGGNIEVPDVTNMSQADATAAIEKAGLTVGKVTKSNDDKIAEGNVISQDPKSGSKVSEKTAVNLVVSQGAEKVEVPDLTNMTASEARAALQKLGLKYEAGTAEYSDKVAENHVVRQDPKAGTSVDKNSTVTYFLSAGQEGIEVPKVVGETEGSATAILNNAGFKVTTEYKSSDSVEKGKVISQTPDAGKREKKDATINIVVSSGAATHSVTVAAGVGGSVYPGSTTVNDGDNVTFTVTPNTGYQVESAVDNYGEAYNASSGSFTIYGVTADTAVTVTFSQIPTQTYPSDVDGAAQNDNNAGGSGSTSNASGTQKKN